MPKSLSIEDFEKEYYILDPISDVSNGKVYSCIKNGKKYAIKFEEISEDSLESDEESYNFYQNKFVGSIFEFYFQVFNDYFVIKEKHFMKNILFKNEKGITIAKVSNLELCDLYTLVSKKEKGVKIKVREKSLNLYDSIILSEFGLESVFSIYLMGIYYKIIHDDLHHGNVLVKSIDFTRVYKFVHNEKIRYFAFTNKYCPLIIDFDSIVTLDGNFQFCYEGFVCCIFAKKYYKIFESYFYNPIFYKIFFTKFCQRYEIFKNPVGKYKVFDLDKLIV